MVARAASVWRKAKKSAEAKLSIDAGFAFPLDLGQILPRPTRALGREAPELPLAGAAFPSHRNPVKFRSLGEPNRGSRVMEDVIAIVSVVGAFGVIILIAVGFLILQPRKSRDDRWHDR